MKEIIGTIVSPKGFMQMASIVGGEKKEKPILAGCSEVPASAAAVFTTNQVQAAPVLVTKRTVENRKASGSDREFRECECLYWRTRNSRCQRNDRFGCSTSRSGLRRGGGGIYGNHWSTTTDGNDCCWDSSIKSFWQSYRFQKAILTTDLVEKIK